MSVLYTITAYIPSIGGAQLHLHEFVKQIKQYEQTGVVCHWNENRTDWLYGTTLNAPPEQRLLPIDNIPIHRLSLDAEQREKLRFWVWFYRIFQGQAITRISDAILDNLRDCAIDLLGEAPTLIHNSRVGREGLTAASLKLARTLDVPFVLTPNHHHHWKGWIYRHYLQVYREADALIAYTNTEKNELAKLGVSPQKIHVLGIGPLLAENPDAARFRDTHTIPHDVPMILFLGQKYAYKRFHLLLEAVPLIRAQFPNAFFVFIGPRTDHSKKIFESMDDSHIIEHDTVDLQTKTDALAACDVMCMPSAKESFGGVYLEAWMLEKPVIGGDAPAIQEIITDGETGFIVGKDSRLLAKRIIQLLDDPDLRQKTGTAGKAFAQNYRWEVLGNQLHDIYNTMRGG